MRLRIAAAGLLLGLSGLITLPFIATGTVTTQPASAPQTPTNPLVVRCTDGTPTLPHLYFFDEKKEGPGSFGPSADKGNDDAVKRELVRRLCGDKHTGQDFALLAVINRLYETAVPHLGTTPDAPTDVASRLVYKGIDWNRSRVVATTVPDGALTLFMQRRTGDELTVAPGLNVPHILATPMSDAHRHSRFLELHFNGSSRPPVLLRLPCGFQPVFTDAHAASLIAD